MDSIGLNVASLSRAVDEPPVAQNDQLTPPPKFGELPAAEPWITLDYCSTGPDDGTYRQQYPTPNGGSPTGPLLNSPFDNPCSLPPLVSDPLPDYDATREKQTEERPPNGNLRA